MPYFSRPSRSPSSRVAERSTIRFLFSLMASYAIGKGFDARVIDAVVDRRPDWKDEVERLDPRVIVVDTSTPSIMNDVRIADELQKIFPKSKVILVGRHVTHAPKESLSFCKQVRIVARGEFFVPVLEILQGKEYQSVRGVSYKEGRGTSQPERRRSEKRGRVRDAVR